jgi:hypothetical protein
MDNLLLFEETDLKKFKKHPEYAIINEKESSDGGQKKSNGSASNSEKDKDM